MCGKLKRKSLLSQFTCEVEEIKELAPGVAVDEMKIKMFELDS